MLKPLERTLQRLNVTDGPSNPLLCRTGLRAQVRGGDDVAAANQVRIAERIEHVRGIRSNGPGLQQTSHQVVIDHVALGHVDDQRTRRETGLGGATNEVVRFGCQPHAGLEHARIQGELVVLYTIPAP